MSEGDFLSRWSRRKTAARNPSTTPPPAEAAAPIAAPAPAAATPSPVRAEPAPLPPIETLTPDSDFTPFMKAEVDPAMKRRALRTLFRDPHFNVMDGLDTYIDDYSKPDPLPEGWLEKMNQFSHLGDRGERDREEAARAKAAAEAKPDAATAEKIEREQPLAATPAQAPSDTPDAISPPSRLQES